MRPGPFPSWQGPWPGQSPDVSGRACQQEIAAFSSKGCVECEIWWCSKELALWRRGGPSRIAAFCGLSEPSWHLLGWGGAGCHVFRLRVLGRGLMGEGADLIFYATWGLGERLLRASVVPPEMCLLPRVSDDLSRLLLGRGGAWQSQALAKCRSLNLAWKRRWALRCALTCPQASCFPSWPHYIPFAQSAPQLCSPFRLLLPGMWGRVTVSYALLGPSSHGVSVPVLAFSACVQIRLPRLESGHPQVAAPSQALSRTLSPALQLTVSSGKYLYLCVAPFLHL